jgi:hypothetical protein
MNIQLADLLNLSGAAHSPWLLSVDPDPAGEADGGGGDPPVDDEELGQAGLKTLREEREQRKALERKLAQLESQLSTVKDLNPDTYREAQRKADELQRQLLEREQLTASERQRMEAKAQEQIRKATQQAETEKAKRIDLQVRTLARGVFSAAEGRDGADNSGLSFFDAWMEFQGRRHLRVEDATGKLYVVDGDGDRMKTAEGQDMDPVAWLNQQADNSPVVGTFFKPKGGEGSGGFVGARGIRGTQTRSVEQARQLKGSALLSEHYGS